MYRLRIMRNGIDISSAHIVVCTVEYDSAHEASLAARQAQRAWPLPKLPSGSEARQSALEARSRTRVVVPYRAG